MNKNELNIILVQSDIFWEDISQNINHFAGLLDKISKPVDLVVLPEMFSTGFTTDVKVCAETMNGLSVNFLKESAAKLNCPITGSLLIADGSAYYNRLFFVLPDGSFNTYDKRHLFRLSDEYKIMHKGNKKIIIQYDNWNILPLVCYDLRFPVWSKNSFDKGKYAYDLILYPANWPESRLHVWRSLLVARAIENQAYVIGVNRIGADGYGTRHAGHSLAIDPKGTIIADAGESETLLKVTISMEELTLFRESFKIGLDWDRFNIEI